MYLALQLRQLFGQLCLCGLRKLMVQTALILLLHTFFILHLQERRGGAIIQSFRKEKIDSNITFVSSLIGLFWIIYCICHRRLSSKG